MAELIPIQRVVSKLDNRLTYDNILEDSSLLVLDKDHESNLHYINIFGRNYLICMGKMYRQEENEDICYFIVYLMYDDKVVSKLGVYEMNIKNIKNEKNIDFSSLDLIIKGNYYTYPESLEPYSIDDTTLQEIISSSTTNINKEDADEEKEEGEIDDEEEDLFDGDEDINKVLYNITNGGKQIVDLLDKQTKNPPQNPLTITPSTIYYYVQGLKQIITEKKIKGIINNHISYIQKHVFHVDKSKNVLSTMNVLIESNQLQYSNVMFNLLEYLLYIKIITKVEYKDNDNKEDEYGDFSLYGIKNMNFNFHTKKQHKKTNDMYNDYKPNKFMFINIIVGTNGEKQYSVNSLNGKYAIEYNDIKEDMKNTIKQLYEYDMKEYPDETKNDELYTFSGNEYSDETNKHFIQLFGIKNNKLNINK